MTLEIRPDLRGHRRLDVRAVARRVLSQGAPHAKELAYASGRLTSIEVNGTFYRSQTPATFRKWASEVPPGFVFSLKGPRFATNRRVLKEAGDSIKRFLDSGITELAIVSGRCCGNSRRPRNSMLPISEAFSNSCRTSSTAERCVTSSKCGTTVSARPNLSRCCGSSRCRPCSPTTPNTRTSPTYRRFRLCPPATGQGQDRRRPIRRKRSPPGRRALNLGGRKRARRFAARSAVAKRQVRRQVRSP